jgi:hypothetical protein
MNVEIRTEAAQFPEKDYINGIFVAVSAKLSVIFHLLHCFSQKFIRLCAGEAQHAKPTFIIILNYSNSSQV